MPYESLIQTLIAAVETELQNVVGRANGPGLEELHHMLAYHLGWEGQGAGPEARGKRIRPLLLLLTTAAAGGDWECALPAAAAVELVHNFSLIHDDIEDNSPLRHGRQTLWKIWGLPQAINAGDAMFALAYLAVLDLEKTVSASIALQGSRILQETCLRLTQGQYMDLSYEARGDLKPDAYWPMITGKTAALLATCTELGALIAGAKETTIQSYREFGQSLGLAFQAQDDLLGIWGNEALTGKSAESDLLSGKKSLPVLFGLSRNGPFARRWAEGPITPGEVPHLAEQLDHEGARSDTQLHVNRLTEQALQALKKANPHGKAGKALHTLALRLLNRQG